MNNTILDTDSYKSSHPWKYPGVLFFGLQYYLKEYLTKPITMEMVEEAKAFFSLHGEPFPYDGWKHIVDKSLRKW